MRDKISKRTKEKHQKAIRNVINGLSRKVEVYMQPRRIECFNCHFDKFTDRSTGKCKYTPTQALFKQQEWEDAGNVTVRYKWFSRGRCPICHGRGYLEILRKTWIDALVTWDPSARGYGNTMTYSPAGAEGSTIVALKTNPKHFDLLKNSTKLLVDGVECKISKPPLLRGLGTQAILIVTAFTTEKQSIDSNEIIKDYT